MTSTSQSVEARAQAYTESQGIVIRRFLGGGYDGTVLATNRKSAIKVLNWQALYEQERDVYLRLKQHQIREIAGCAVPELITYDDALWVTEMSIVVPPYVLDFAGARLDVAPDYPADVRRRWLREKRLQFGASWKYVPRIVVAFERMGIFLSDLNPRNLCLTHYEVP